MGEEPAASVPPTYAAEAEAAGRVPPIPPELFGRLFADYERAKQRAGQIDFDDMLTLTVELLETDDDSRRTRPVAQALAERGRVPGHQPAPGATPRAVARRWPRPVRGGRRGPDDLHVHRRDAGLPHGLRRAARGRADHPPYRELPLHAADPRARQSADRGDRAGRRACVPRDQRVPCRPSGGSPTTSARTAADRGRRTAAHRPTGSRPQRSRVLVRTNAQLVPLEQAFTRAGVAYQVRGQRFYERRDVRDAIRVVRDAGLTVDGPRLRARRPRPVVQRARLPGRGRADRRRGARADCRARHAPGNPRRRRRARPGRRGARRSCRARGSRRGRAPRIADRHQPAHLPPRQGHGMGRRLPADARGRLPADPPRRGGAGRPRRGAPALLRRHHAGTPVHLALSWAERRTGQTGREAAGGPAASSTTSGRRAAHGSSSCRTPCRGRRARTAGESSPLIEALRAWRTGRARADAMAPFIVAHDSLLIALADVRPATIAELRRVKGMGPTKIDRYGDEILAVIGSVPKT